MLKNFVTYGYTLNEMREIFGNQVVNEALGQKWSPERVNDLNTMTREEYIKKHYLPFHPLVAKGYHSIGCKHCTVPGKGREGRWNNSPKTECGLHL